MQLPLVVIRATTDNSTQLGPQNLLMLRAENAFRIKQEARKVGNQERHCVSNFLDFSLPGFLINSSASI